MRKWLRTSGNYLKWHYGKALPSTFSFWENIFLYLFNYFSIKNLARNFFKPYGQIRDMNKTKNFLLIVWGMFVRGLALIFGILVIALYIILLPFSLVIWLFLPLFVIWLIGYGLILIFFA